MQFLVLELGSVLLLWVFLSFVLLIVLSGGLQYLVQSAAAFCNLHSGILLLLLSLFDICYNALFSSKFYPFGEESKLRRIFGDSDGSVSTFLGLIRFKKDMSRCSPLRGLLDRAMDRYVHIFPCLSDPARRSSLGLKVALVVLHILYVGILFLFDGDLIEKTKTQPWYTVLYLLLFFATLIQYFITSCSSPGYVLDAMRTVNENSLALKWKSISSNKDNLLQLGTNLLGNGAISWTKMVLDLYPPGTSIRTLTCSYCNVEQPPRVKHCHDCDRCVLQFDHHCVWLGTCIGHDNHCRFWWYICEETALCLWTGILYISYLKAHITIKAWWKAAIMIVLLISLTLSFIFLILLLLFHSYLVLTNQTTYELVRRRRIPYLRGFPERVYPFSRGICGNLYSFCCGQSSLEPLPSAVEVEQKMKPYTCLDVITCRCC